MGLTQKPAGVQIKYPEITAILPKAHDISAAFSLESLSRHELKPGTVDIRVAIITPFNALHVGDD